MYAVQLAHVPPGMPPAVVEWPPTSSMVSEPRPADRRLIVLFDGYGCAGPDDAATAAAATTHAESADEPL